MTLKLIKLNIIKKKFLREKQDLKKSFIFNKNLKQKKKFINFFFLKKTRICCLFSNRHKALNKKFSISRHTIIKLSKLNSLQNFTINSW